MDTNILFDTKGIAITPDKINKKIKKFGKSYNNTVQKIIENLEAGVESFKQIMKSINGK